MVVKFGEFKGHKTISLSRGDDDKYPFTFGIAKARLVLEHLEDIKKFIEENDQASE